MKDMKKEIQLLIYQNMKKYIIMQFVLMVIIHLL